MNYLRITKEERGEEGLIENTKIKRETVTSGKEEVCMNKKLTSLVETNSCDEIKDNSEITDENQTKCGDNTEIVDTSQFDQGLADVCKTEEAPRFENKPSNSESKLLIFANLNACDEKSNGDKDTEMVDTSQFDQGLADVCKTEEAPRFENKSSNSESELQILANLNACEEKNNVDNIASKQVSRKSDESKKLIWEVHSDTFIKSTKKSGWKVTDKINDPVQKGCKAKQESCSHSEITTNELLPLESKNEKENSGVQPATDSGLKIPKNKKQALNITNPEQSLSKSEIETTTESKINAGEELSGKELDKSSELKCHSNTSKDSVAIHKTNTNTTKQNTESVTLNLQETKGKISGSLNLEPSSLEIENNARDNREQKIDKKFENNIPMMVENKPEENPNEKKCTKDSKIETDTLKKSHDDEKSCREEKEAAGDISSQMIDKELDQNTAKFISCNVNIEDSNEDENKLELKCNGHIKDDMAVSNKGLEKLKKSDESTQNTKDMHRQKDPEKIDSNIVENNLNTLPMNNQNSEKVLEFENKSRNKTPETMEKNETDQNKEAKHNVEELLLNSDLPEVVEDPEFENRLKVFHNYRNFGAMYTAKKNFKKAEWAFKNGIKQTAGKPARSKEQLRRIIMAEIEFRLARARSLLAMGMQVEAREEGQAVLSMENTNQEAVKIIQQCQ